MSRSGPTEEVEQLVRRTFSKVAERTTVSAHADGDEAYLLPSRSRLRARQLLAAVAAVVLVVGALAVLATRDGGQPAGRDAPTRILPGWVPHLDATDGSGVRRLALTEVRSNAERDRITYASNAASITVELDRTRSMPSDGEPVIVRGVPGRRTGSTWSWLGPDDALVEVSWSGDVDGLMIESFVKAIAYVDDDMWLDATGTGGFRRHDWAPLATSRIDADVSFDVDLVGHLHEGLSLRVGALGLLLGLDRCDASTNFETSHPESYGNGYVISARGDITSAVVRVVGYDDRRIELTSLLPLVDISIGGVVYKDRPPGSPPPSVDCEDPS